MINFGVEKITSNEGKEFVRTHHYSHGIHNGPMCWGLFDANRLIGVCAFATPASENVRASVFGREHVNRVTELHRLVIVDDTPKNTESWFISRVLDLLKKSRPDLWAVVSFADPTEGHRGVIYQACNAIYYGVSAKARFYLDKDGRLRHPRQNGINITLKAARDRGWVPTQRLGKHRYLFLLGNGKKQRKQLVAKLMINSLPYPKD